jgi:hypothetical protein
MVRPAAAHRNWTKGTTLRWFQTLLTGAALIVARGASADSLIGELVERFSTSEFELLRGQTDVPFPPLAWITQTAYERADISDANGQATGREYQQRSTSEGLLLPVPVGRRDLLLAGEWAELTRFQAKDDSASDVNVLSVAVPVGWARQLKHDWQVAAFAAPLGHKSSQDGWYWEGLGGVFWRYSKSARTTWLFGAYFDVSSFEEFYTPYAGASFDLGRHWSIDVVLPWPGVTYAPNSNWMVRIGATSAGSSWTVGPQATTLKVNVTGIDVGLHAAHRVYHNIWLGIEAGASGFRGLTFSGSGWQPLEGNLEGKLYGLLTVNFRPSLSADQ